MISAGLVGRSLSTAPGMSANSERVRLGSHHDRALTFTGNWADFDMDTLKAFQPWNKR